MKETGVKIAPFTFKEQDLGTQIGCVFGALGLSMPLVILFVALVL